MSKAWCLLRDRPWYRREAFERGLKMAGFQVHGRAPDRGAAGEVLLIWNRYGAQHDLAARFEYGGGTVLVAENGYLGRGGTSPKFDVHPGGPKPEHYYALARSWHNGRGSWPAGGPERFDALGVELKPWRAAETRESGRAGERESDSRHVLVCPNRSFGVGEQMMHPDWAQRCAAHLRQQTKRPVRIRAHPGNDAPKRTLAEDLAGAWAVFIWSSGAGVHALASGIPVFCAAPYWILKGAAATGSVDAPVTPERRPWFERMAWAQWRLEEIETGAPFRSLLRIED